MDNNNASAFTAVETGMYDYNIRFDQRDVSERALPPTHPSSSERSRQRPPISWGHQQVAAALKRQELARFA